MIWKVLLDQEIQYVSRFGNQIIIEEILFGRLFVKKDRMKKSSNFCQMAIWAWESATFHDFWLENFSRLGWHTFSLWRNVGLSLNLTFVNRKTSLTVINPLKVENCKTHLTNEVDQVKIKMNCWKFFSFHVDFFKYLKYEKQKYKSERNQVCYVLIEKFLKYGSCFQ